MRRRSRRRTTGAGSTAAAALGSRRPSRSSLSLSSLDAPWRGGDALRLVPERERLRRELADPVATAQVHVAPGAGFGGVRILARQVEPGDRLVVAVGVVAAGE